MTDSKPNDSQNNETPDTGAAAGSDIDWDAALAEQAGQPRQTTQADGLSGDTDDWASALAEQTAAQQPAATAAAAVSSAQHVFQPLTDSDIESNSDIDMIMDIPVQLSVELGRTRLTIKNILQLGQGSVVELDGLAGEPMDIFVNGYLIAQGEVVVVEEKYGIRVTDIITPSDRISRLNGRR
ncbi:flagellar motor switch protein FliN [Pollutimonas harenae]|uniref:Flagellar motor switch protein FliN n=1 Tax=Pollutimonas harenae TaxID=657015 RepID=A0A853H6V5_9BURK|nr:flagellar motor switch protein FliN [Pollutimonas harenae]NYT86243.1 flagellar motor switch protein FliN [Pollutimonas harenae]TEA71273.1 flagellar motor switch protein FliN [Pollutimonas harenae]